MNESIPPAAGPESHREANARVHRPPLLIALVVVLFIEALGVIGVTVWLLVELLTVEPVSYPGAVAIVVLVAIAAAWVVATAIGALQAGSWARASTVTIQILLIAVAVGSFQGFYARPDLGWALLVPALVGIVLALTPQVIKATSRNTSQHE
ncbi:hypothetical protein [Leifsonia poae]|uniref:hypothetical protein n=1 Tax=Leifsonia poae TaxID=110933 RepID=UPI001CBF62DC|nr:hypothetical protein [Leifsonia poae]